MNENQKESGLDEIIALMSATLPKETIIELLERAISDYKADPSEEKFKYIGTVCLSFLNREMVLITAAVLPVHRRSMK